MAKQPKLTDIACISEIAKVDVIGAVDSWLFRQKRKLKDLEEKEKQGEYIDEKWLEGFKLRLKNVEHAKDQILDLPTCEGGKLE